MGQQRCMGLRFCQDQGESRECRNQLGRHKWTVYHSKRDHSGVLHNNKWILKRTQQGNLQVLHKCNDISFGYIHIWNWSFFYTTAIWGQEIQLKAHTFATKLCVHQFFSRPDWKILHLAKFFYTTSNCDDCDKYQVWIYPCLIVNNHQYVRTVKI